LKNKKEIVSSKKLPWFIIIVTAALTAMAIPRLLQLKIDYDIENFFDPEDSDLIYYHQHRETFESDNNFILIAIENKKGIFNEDFLHLIDSVTKHLKDLKYVENIVSPTTLKKVIKVPIVGYINAPVIHLNEPERLAEDKEIIYNTNDFFQSFFSQDTASVLIYLTKDVSISASANDSLLHNIESTLKTFNCGDFHIAGKIKTQNYYVTTVNKEMKLLTAATSLLLVLFLIYTFKRFWSVAVPLLILLTSLIFTMTLIQVFIGALDLLMTLIPTLLFIIGVSNSVHILTGYNEEIGFISLYFIDIPPIQNFGIATAFGVMITWLVSITVLPSAICITQTKKYTNNLKKEKKWNKILTPLFHLIFKYKKHTIIIASLLFVISVIGIYKLETNNYVLDDLSEKSSLKKDMRFFESQFAGIRPFEMGFALKDTSLTIFDIQVAREIDTVQYYLENVYGAKMSYSAMTIMKEINRSINGGKQEYYRVPNSIQEMKNIKKYFDKNVDKTATSTLLTKEGKKGRISSKIHDLGQKKVTELNQNLLEFLNKNIHLVDFRITGAPDMMDKTSAYISTQIIKGLIFSFLVVALLMGILFKSVKIALISLIPNVLPLVFVAGLMGLIGIDLKFSTVVIFTIGFGIAVDDTIHLLVRYKIELPNARDKKDALFQSIKTTGKALIITSFVLSSGFLTFLLSDFSSTFYIGLLISITLLFALISDLFLLPLISDLFLLPILILAIDKNKESK